MTIKTDIRSSKVGNDSRTTSGQHYTAGARCSAAHAKCHTESDTRGRVNGIYNEANAKPFAADDTNTASEKRLTADDYELQQKSDSVCSRSLRSR